MGPGGPGPWIGHARRVHEGMGWGGWVLWILLTVAFWALVVMAVIWLVRNITGRGHVDRRFGGGPGVAAYGPVGPPHVASSAEQILGERYARGEIDENEYRTRLAVLRGEPSAGQGTAPPPEAPPPSA